MKDFRNTEYIDLRHVASKGRELDEPYTSSLRVEHNRLLVVGVLHHMDELTLSPASALRLRDYCETVIQEASA
tara:strand:+ start:255 stop:473 length:219 start_codon:yes stop_codon:yes gene_type:complete